MEPLRIVYWIFFGTTVVVFWISLRTEVNALYYTIAAIVLWGATYGIHRLIKKREKQEEE